MSAIPGWMPASSPFSTLSYRHDPDYWRNGSLPTGSASRFPGQFRNWFYSTAGHGHGAREPAALPEVFGYASLLAEDGRPMHKSSGNSIEFNDAADKMGVDIMRWLYCAHKPENDLLFGYQRAEETRRRFHHSALERLFLLRHLCQSGWLDTRRRRVSSPGHRKDARPSSDNPLDQLDPGTSQSGGRTGHAELRRFGCLQLRPWHSKVCWTISATGMCAAHAAASGSPNMTVTRIQPIPPSGISWSK